MLNKSFFGFSATLLAIVCLTIPFLVITLGGCADTATVVRKFTYPPDFKYVSGQELRSSMDKLAFQLQQLDQALAEDDSGQPVQQQQVIGILRDIERIGASLQAGDAGANHPFLQDYMTDFVANTGQARIAAALDPPRYYLAGRIAGACINCHQVNR